MGGETFASRTLEAHYKPTKTNRDKKNHLSRWAGIIGTVIMDEEHRLRHHETNFFSSMRILEINLQWILTATPAIKDFLVVSSDRYEGRWADRHQQDVLGPLMILWPKLKKEFGAGSLDIFDLKTAVHELYLFLQNSRKLHLSSHSIAHAILYIIHRHHTLHLFWPHNNIFIDFAEEESMKRPFERNPGLANLSFYWGGVSSWRR